MGQGFSVRATAWSLNCNRSTVQDYIERAREAGIAFPLSEELTNAVVQERDQIKYFPKTCFI